MQTVRQSMRPRHQVLVLKCYPKFQKGQPEVKPNPSELSYLLYYASTRRSKVQKVGAFLEKKSAGDVYRQRVGNVQVTLHIIRALIDKSPRDIPLYAPYVLRIFAMILQCKDLTMVEDSVPAFQAFCEHQEGANLAADLELVKKFEEIVQAYADFAESPQNTSRSKMSETVAIRWRTAGLNAIKSLTANEAAMNLSGKLIGKVIPVITLNLFPESEEKLLLLSQKASAERETALRRRMSVNTVSTAQSQAPATPGADNPQMSETTADADRLAEEEVGLLALQSLKQIFSASGRAQIRVATTALLSFFIEKCQPATRPDTRSRPGTARTSKTARITSWRTTLIETVTRWTPVQDRFIVIITAVENLVKSPVNEDNIQKQLVLASIISWLLSSTINMIGLSIMDVLLGLVQHILLLLQLGGSRSNVLPLHPQTDAIELFNEAQPDSPALVEQSEELSPSVARQELLDTLQKCIGELATHIYYGDQVRDMISAILQRLKPPMNTLAGTTSAIENPAAAAQAIADSAKIREDPSTDDFFSFGTARVTALSAIKQILEVANRAGAAGGANAIGRNRVSVITWEGTQWLLRDEDRRVRRAYVDALLTWLRLEMSKRDLRISENLRIPKRKTTGSSTGGHGRDSLTTAGRRMSNVVRSSFLQLLHLAIYENALESPDEDSDILLSHLLLVSLIHKLGVNAVRTGLPMVVRLQEDINSDSVDSPKAKVNVGSLVHGYFWALADFFEFDNSMTGFEIQREIARRRKAHLWLDSVTVPPRGIDVISGAGAGPPPDIAKETVQSESLKPFDNIKSLVDRIETAYASFVKSPVNSTPTSPSRGLAGPILAQAFGTASSDGLPEDFKKEMLSDWTKESCIASAEYASGQEGSPHGSRSGTTRSAPNGKTGNGEASREGSLGLGLTKSRQDKSNSMLHPPGQHHNRFSSAPGSGSGTPASSSENRHTLKVEDLKRVLASGALADTFRNQTYAARDSSPLRKSNTAYVDFGNDSRGEVAQAEGNHDRPNTRPSFASDGSESLVEAEGYESASEGDPDHRMPEPQGKVSQDEIAEEYTKQLGRRPYDAGAAAAAATIAAAMPQKGSRPSSNGGSHKGSRPSSKQDAPRRSTESGGGGGGSRPTSRNNRARSNSETSAEDPVANVRALKGELVPDVIRGDKPSGVVVGAGGGPGSIGDDDDIPPVPPLPKGLVGKLNASIKAKEAAAAAAAAANAASASQGATSTARSTLTGTPTEADGETKSAGAHTHASDSVGESLGSSLRGVSAKGAAAPKKDPKSIVAAAAERRNMAQALLGSIEVGDVGGKGIGRPPY